MDVDGMDVDGMDFCAENVAEAMTAKQNRTKQLHENYLKRKIAATRNSVEVSDVNEDSDDEVVDLNPVETSRQKRTQQWHDAYERRKTAKEANDANTSSSSGNGVGVNADAERFLKDYDARTQFWECGVCGTDEGLVNLQPLDDATMAIIETSDLPVLHSMVIDSLKRSGKVHDAYQQSMQEEFNEYGVLKNARHVCNSCLGTLKKGYTIRMKAADKSKSSTSATSANDTHVTKNGSGSNISSTSSSSSNDQNGNGLQTIEKDLNTLHLRECGFIQGEEGKDEEQEEEEANEEEDDVGIIHNEGNAASANVWTDEMDAALKNMKTTVPATAYIRGLYPGIIPKELRDLRVVEASMISIFNPITKLKLHNGKGMSYKYYHGNAHTYTIVNDLTTVASHLPWIPSLNTFAILKYKNEVCVKELKYRPAKVRAALMWLKEHNPLYKDIILQFPEEWEDMGIDDELEPESMEIDEAEEEEMRNAKGTEKEQTPIENTSASVACATGENGNAVLDMEGKHRYIIK